MKTRKLITIITKGLLSYVVLFLCGMWAVASSPAAEALTEENPLVSQSQLLKFLSWWPGEYNNSKQVAEQSAAGINEQERNAHTSLKIRRVDLPTFGEHVYYAQWQDFEPPNNITRQRMYAFEIDGSMLRLNLHVFPTDLEFRQRTAGAYSDPTKLAGLTPADMYPLSGCSVFFNVQRDAFVGEMKKQQCAFTAPDSDVPIYSWSQMRLRERSFRYLDSWFRSDGTLYKRFSSDWFVFEKRIDAEK